MDCNLDSVAEKFHSLLKSDLSEAVKYVAGDEVITTSISHTLQQQVTPDKFSSSLFEWLYTCAQLKPQSKELFTFSLQFVPELIYLYLTAIYEEHMEELKANAEALLTTLMIEVMEDGRGAHHTEQVPALSKSSIYHQTPSQTSQLFLTEAVLQLHNELDQVPKRPNYSSTSISVNNRLQFLSSVIHTFCDHLMLFNTTIKMNFCHFCIRVSLQGMANLESNCAAILDQLPAGDHGNLLTMKRFSISDDFITSLLRGIRICLFQPCHQVATQALQALTLRAEYELLINSIQVSHTILRLASNVEPRELQLDSNKYSKYHGAGSPEFCDSPADIHASLNSHLLHHNLTQHTSDSTPKMPTPNTTSSLPSSLNRTTPV